MIVVNRIGENINVSYKDKEFNVRYAKETFDVLLGISEKSMTVTTMAELEELVTQAELVCTESLSTTYDSFHDELTYNPHQNKYYLKLNDVVCNVALPEAMVWRLEESIEKEIDVTPIIKNLKLVLRNPKMIKGGPLAEDFFERYCDYINMTYIDPAKVSDYMEQGIGLELAEEKAKTYEVKITQEGLIACFKTSNEIITKFELGDNDEVKEVSRYKKKFNPDTGEIEGDDREDSRGEDRIFTPYMMGNSGDAFYCEGVNGYEKPGHFIKIGCTHRLPDWSYVNTNDNDSCVKGLHLGGLSYIAHWDGADIHTCLVNPIHIGAIPDYASDKAIRVLQYYVHGSLVTINHNIYHSSTYAKQTEEEWSEINAEILSQYGEYKDEVKEQIKYIKSL